MSRTNPELALIGMVLTVAGESAMDSVAPLREALRAVPAAAFVEHASAYTAIQGCLDAGVPPTAANLHDADGQLSSALFTAARRAADDDQGYNSIAAAAAEVLRRHKIGIVDRATRAVSTALERGDLEAAIRELRGLDYGELSGLGSQLKDFLDYDLDAPEEPRAFPLSHAALNAALGGGLGSGGAYGLSLWVAPSGHGKSSFWYGEAPHQLGRGNWVVFAAAESDAANIFAQVVRIEAGLTEGAFVRRNRTPRAESELRKARARLEGYVQRGQLQVWDEAFTPEGIRELAETKLAEMRDAGATGKLIIIVDNYDALFEDIPEGQQAGPQAVNREMQRLQRHTKDFDYHIALLAQASTEAEQLKGPCHTHDVYGNRKLAMKVAHMVTMYRPQSEADLALTDASGAPAIGSKAWLAVRKKRGHGTVGALIEMEARNPLGAWKEADALPI